MLKSLNKFFLQNNCLFRSGDTFAVVKKKCATGYYSLGHEIGHMFGCVHNK